MSGDRVEFVVAAGQYVEDGDMEICGATWNGEELL